MNLDPQWIAGFVDGEGCFHISVNPHKEMTTGFQILPEFTVVQHERDIHILYALKDYFKCGVVRVNHGDRMAYRVRGLDHLCNTIIPFFDEFHLITQKRIEFEKFKSVIQMMKQRLHLSEPGIHKIRLIRNSMNRKQVKIKSDLHGNMQRGKEIIPPSSDNFVQNDVTM